MVLTDQSGGNSWPMMASSYILIYKDQKASAQKADIMLKFFGWAFDSGANIAGKLNYVPMPKNVSDMVKESWQNNLVTK